MIWSMIDLFVHSFKGNIIHEITVIQEVELSPFPMMYIQISFHWNVKCWTYWNMIMTLKSKIFILFIYKTLIVWDYWFIINNLQIIISLSWYSTNISISFNLSTAQVLNIGNAQNVNIHWIKSMMWMRKYFFVRNVKMTLHFNIIQIIIIMSH